MTEIKLKTQILSLLMLGLFGCATAAEDSISDHPGYVDFSPLLATVGDRPNVEVNLNPSLLDFLANVRSLEGRDRRFTEFFTDLQRFNTRSYEGDEIDFKSVKAAMSGMASQLDAEGWQHLLRVNNRDEYFDLHFRLSEDQQTIHGSAIMAVEPGQAMFANYVIDIDVNEIELSELALLMSREWQPLLNDH